ncbi:thiamine pyrophosphate-dependent enzyme [Govanella unica]|uniref:Thiamine pyrophosphate-binding protein n=1 Tax=Govanella unica TaxID=2975056 RepID=A0A9X3Z783_9PROT|nr:thiamine pyrophosphate-dependent enzyme [Govania unica]MDA5193877.1 thiamine pyrophosphate-binding protein [Govania unica]
MKGGKVLVDSVLEHGIETIFGIPGGQTYELFDAFYDRGNQINLITSRSEQGAAYMAFGYARSTGKVGVFTVVPGPGVLNTGAALTTAYACNAPVLCLTGQVPSTGIGKGIGYLHDIPDQLGVLERMTKWAKRIDHPAHAPAAVREAFHQLTTGRRRPVALEMAPDIMSQAAEVTMLSPVQEQEPITADLELIVKAAALLGASKNPMIMIGSGAIEAGEELRELAEMLQAPVISQRGGRGVLSDRHYLSHSFPAGHRLWPDVDVVIAVGTRFKYPRMHWGTDVNLKIIHIDIDPTEINRISTPDVGIVGDAKKSVAALIPELAKTNRKRESREAEFEKFKAEMRAEFDEHVQPQMGILHAIRAELPDDGIFVDEITQVGYASWYGFPVYAPRTFISSGYAGNLGYGFPTAIGVKVANPDRKVIAICGDGGFMFHCGELATAVKYGLNLVTIIFSDGAFTNVARAQDTRYNGRVIGTDLKNPDFVAMAESFGATGYKATTIEELREKIRLGFEQKGPVIIEMPIGKTDFPWKFLLLPKVRSNNS